MVDSRPGQTLDDLVRGLIQQNDATPLLGDKRTLRFETERSVRVGTDTIISHSVVYMTPVPGSARKRALVLVAGFGRPVDMSSDADVIQATRFLLDACVSTLTWRVPAPAVV